MKIITVISFLLLMIAVQAKAQLSQPGISRNRLTGKLTGTVYYTPPSGNSELFLLKEWQRGTILLTDGDLFEGALVNYNMMDDELVIFNEDLKQFVTIDKGKVREFKMILPEGARWFVKIGTGEKSRYFEQAYNGTYSLLVFHYIYIQKNKPYRDEYGQLKHTRLLRRMNFYMYVHEDNRLVYLQKNHRALIQHLPGNKKDMRRALRRGRLQGSKEEKLVRAFKVLDEAGLMKK
jgi:hypothetical protein